MAHQPYARLDAAPIVNAIRARAVTEPHPATPVWNLVHRARRDGVLPFWTADVICVRLLGVHPATLYGEAWWDVIAS